MAAGKDYARQVKGALLLIGILILGGVIVLFVVNRQQSVPDQPENTAAKENATIAIEGLHHIDIKEGVKDWVLDADVADYHQEEKRAYLSGLKATFFNKDGDRVFLSAESGTWKRDSNDLEVNGNVVLKNSQYEMHTDTLIYTNAKRIFVTRSPVTIHGALSDQKFNGMTYPLDTERIVLDGNVEGEFGK